MPAHPHHRLTRNVRAMDNVIFVCFQPDLPQVPDEEDVIVDLLHHWETDSPESA
jgi:hypothetical protein